MNDNQRRLAVLAGAVAMALVALLPWPGTRSARISATSPSEPTAAAQLSRATPTSPSSRPSPSRPARPGCTTAAAVQAGQAALADLADLDAHDARWVAFCPVGEGDATAATGADRVPALVPTHVLTHRVRPLVRGWSHRLASLDHSCPAVLGADAFRIQVGYADGSVAQIDGDTGACQASAGASRFIDLAAVVYDDLLTALAHQTGRRLPPGQSDPPTSTCPQSPDDLDQNVDGASARVTGDEGPLLALPAVGGVLCRYTPYGYFAQQSPLDAETAEALRLAVGSSSWAPGEASAPAPPRRTSFVVVLLDRTGTTRTFGVSGRHRTITLLRGDGTAQELGFAGDRLSAALPGRYS